MIMDTYGDIAKAVLAYQVGVLTGFEIIVIFA